MSDVKNQDLLLIESLHKHLMISVHERSVLKRSIWRKSTDDLSVYQCFLKVTENRVPRYHDDRIDLQELYFTVVCLYYIMSRPEDQGTAYVKFENLLQRLYFEQTDSTKRKIASLINCEYDSENGMFLKQFVSLAIRCQKELQPGEKLDFIGLLYDLKHWNDDDKKVRLRWAETTHRFIKGE